MASGWRRCIGLILARVNDRQKKARTMPGLIR
jgi:hypothetical protein